MNRDEIEGKATEAKGEAKRVLGDVLDDEQLRNEGEADQAAGQVQGAIGKGRRKLGEAIEELGDQIKK
jgi:uncharacterized protein YjbJ (UPF0337 family)